ncbi:MAG: von Willebrand factor type A domain-containing protein [Planctomycetaceae bacterium]
MSTPEADFQEERLTAYALGELGAEERADVERQLAESAELRQELQELQGLVTELRAKLSVETMPRLTETQHRQLQTETVALSSVSTKPALSQSPGTSRQRCVRRWAILGAELACGLAFVGVVTSFAWRRTILSEPLPSQTASVRFNGIVTAEQDKLGTATVPPRLTGLQTAAPNDELAEYRTTSTFTVQKSLADLVKNEKPNASVTVATDGRQDGLIRHNEPYFKQAYGAVESKNQGLEARAKTPTVALYAEQESRFRYIAPKDLSPQSPLSDQQVPGETYQASPENLFVTPADHPLSTFSIDVDTASYANLRRFLTQGQLPPADAVRIEEMINAFTYNYPRPKEGEPFSVTADAAPCLWQRGHYIARIALQARTFEKAKRPPTNLVFLLDVSGSMQAANKLPLVKQAMTMLAEELNERDRIAIVTYAGDAGVKLASTPGNDQTRIMQAIEALQAGGSTNGAAGINLAYEEAIRHFNGEGENRVILCTDGDFNVGISDDDQLVKLITEQAKSKVFLSVFGFGMGNLKDAKLEKLADKGNGHYGYIDDMREARRVFNEEMVGTLYTVAKDVKIQVEFNPLTVGAYRLIGYENRALAARDFNDDSKDAGEIGAGHTVTALYEIVPKGFVPKSGVDPLKYSATKEPAPAVQPPTNIPPDVADDLFTVKLRYKLPTADASVKTVDYVVDDIAGKNIVPSTDAKWAAAVAAFGMHLKKSQFKGTWTLDDIYEAALSAKGEDTNRRRQEFLDLIQTTKRLSSK